MTEQELDEILTLRWPAVVRRVMGDARSEEWLKGFVRSIVRQGKRRTWHPSAKQEWLMRRLLAETRPDAADDFNLIDDSDREGRAA